ncbi:MAG: CvpA family protein [Clostridia bacterium]|nr:CvpA family protein [Clostridia bacterium]
MNSSLILDIIFVLIAALIILISTKRGFVANLIRSCKWILAFVAAYLFGPKLGDLLEQLFFGKLIRGFVYDKVNSIYLSAAESFGADQVAEKLPSFLMTEEVKGKLDNLSGTGEELVNSITDTVSAPVSNLISNVLGYIGVFLIALVVLWIAVNLLNGIFEKLTLLGTVDRILGFVWGTVLSCLLLFMIASVLKVFLSTSAIYQDTWIVKFFGDSALLEVFKILDVGKSWFHN